MEKRGQKRRAQANIITVVLIILLVLASIVVVWNVVKKTVEESSGQVGTEALMVQLEVEEAGVGARGGLEVKVKRGSGGGNITSLKFILEDVNGQTYIETISADLPVELETKTYNVFDLLDEGVEVKKISVVPVVGKKFGVEAGKSVDLTISMMAELVSWWKFDGDFIDSVGENHGTEYGDVYIENNVLVLDGDEDYVHVADSDSLDFSDEMTISLWLYPKAEHVGYAVHPINKWTGTANANFVLYYFGTTSGGNKQMWFYANRGDTWAPISGSYTLDLNKWYHIVLSRTSASGGQLYINGAAQGSLTGTGVLATNSAKLEIGTGFNGTIDDVMIFNRSLSLDEIQAIYNNQL